MTSVREAFIRFAWSVSLKDASEFNIDYHPINSLTRLFGDLGNLGRRYVLPRYRPRRFNFANAFEEDISKEHTASRLLAFQVSIITFF